MEKVLIFGVHINQNDSIDNCSDETMDELEQLVETAGGEVEAVVLQNKDKFEVATYIGKGKVEEIKHIMDNNDIQTAICDDELSSIQIKNLEKELEKKVLDRSMLILDIFAKHAHTKEGKLQVELAQLNLTKSKLAGIGQSLSRLGGGIGTRGPGETKLETDRRHIARKISFLNKELDDVEKHRQLVRAKRKKSLKKVFAIVGYTNAGKSTLINALTDANVASQNALFVTLDSTTRKVEFDSKQEALLIDTVGFIRKLPHHLIEAFKSTLEETVEADYLIHVIDASSSEYENHIQVVESILKDLGCIGKRTIYLFNKIDLVEDTTVINHTISNEDRILKISAQNGEGLESLIATLQEFVNENKSKYTIIVPYSESGFSSFLYDSTNVINEEFLKEGTKYIIEIDNEFFPKIKKYVISSDE